MFTMQTLCDAIRLAPEVTQQVLCLHDTLPPLPEGMLRRPQYWEADLQEAARLLGDDPKGFKQLTCMLRAALECHADYESFGFSDEVYVDTMACFTRFVNEHMVSFGCYGFDRGFWTVRQVSSKLFRIGQLEYELLEEKGKKFISLHIPSDADLRLPHLRDSYDAAKPLLECTFPDFAGVDWVCGSWLLSPNLKDLLPPDSRILTFQRSFTIVNTYSEDDFKEWVYKRTDIPNEDLPEDTTLQRNIKAFLLAGGAFLSAEGILCSDPFR